MKFPVKAPVLRPRLFGFKATTGSSGALAIGEEAISSVAGSSTSVLTPTLTKPFGQTSLVNLSTGSDVAAGGDAFFRTSGGNAPSNTTLGDIWTVNATSSSDQGTVYGLVFGQDSESTDTVSSGAYNSGGMQEVKTTRALPRLMVFTFDDSGLTVGAGDGTHSNTSTGRNTVTFNKPFASSDVVAVATSQDTSGPIAARVTAVSATSVEVQCLDSGNSGAAIDKTVTVFVLGSDATSLRDKPSVLECSQPKARLIAVKLSSAGAVVLGGGATASKQATGHYRITFDEPFERIPAVISETDYISATTTDTPTTALVDVYTWDLHTAYAAADKATVVYILGFDAAEILNN